MTGIIATTFFCTFCVLAVDIDTMGMIYFSLRSHSGDERRRKMSNIERLWGIMKERGVSKRALASGIGIDRATLYRKAAKGLDGFTCQEMRDIGRYLRLTLTEMDAIFLSGFSN